MPPIDGSGVDVAGLGTEIGTIVRFLEPFDRADKRYADLCGGWLRMYGQSVLNDLEARWGAFGQWVVRDEFTPRGRRAS